MKILDFHTHFYTARDESAEKYLLEQGLVLPGKGGALLGLKKAMEKNGVSVAVNAPIAWQASQVTEMNRKSILYNAINLDVICLGAMHPRFGEQADVSAEIELLAENGVKGIKLHPQEQDFYPDDPGMDGIYKACIKHGLFVLMHAGAGGDPDFDVKTIKGTPERIARVADKHPALKLVAAHMGGLHMWENAETYLAGKKNVWVDTAFCLPMEDAVLAYLIGVFGAERVLFGTDFPWQDAGEVIKKVSRTAKSDTEREMIFGMNAEELLGI